MIPRKNDLGNFEMWRGGGATENEAKTHSPPNFLRRKIHPPPKVSWLGGEGNSKYWNNEGKTNSQIHHIIPYCTDTYEGTQHNQTTATRFNGSEPI